MYSMQTLKNEGYANKVKASCYPVGYDFKYTGEEILDTPCVNGMMFDETYQFTVDKNIIAPVNLSLFFLRRSL